MNIFIIIGTRPNIIKIVRLYELLNEKHEVAIIHTGQHTDRNMTHVFLEEFGLPVNKYLDAGNKFGNIYGKFKSYCEVDRPDLVIVVGDVTSTLACAVATKHLNIKLAHVEAGYRSFDRGMQEEINRIATDSISDYNFCCDDVAYNNLGGCNKHLVGNTMIDTLVKYQDKYEEKEDDLYCLCTIHRRENILDATRLEKIVTIIKSIPIKVIFPIHPHTRKILEHVKDLSICDPMGYIDFMGYLKNAEFVITDSGGIQEETNHLGVYCLVLRDNTERVAQLGGTNALVGLNIDKIREYINLVLDGHKPQKVEIALNDGRASERIVEIING